MTLLRTLAACALVTLASAPAPAAPPPIRPVATPRGQPQQWKSRAGLAYSATVLQNVVARPTEKTTKAFRGVGHEAVRTVDRAWKIIQKGPTDGRVSVENVADGVKAYVVDLGRPIGFVGGGQHSKQLSAHHLRLVVAGSDRLLSAVPIRGQQTHPNQWKRPTQAPAVYPARAMSRPQLVNQMVKAGIPKGLAKRSVEHVLPGLPSDATYQSLNDRLRVRNDYVLSMNAETKILNWASWITTKDMIGADGLRANNWRPDPTLGKDFPLVEADDYRGALEFHRGHMVRSGERSAQLRSNGKTFVFSNAVPQAKNNNMGPWNGLEEWVKTQAQAGQKVYNQAGPVFAGRVKTIGNGVAVPSSLFKIVTVLGPNETRITEKTRVVAVLIPNNNKIPMTANWADYRVSVAEVEKATGLRFFRNLPAKVADKLRQSVDSDHVPYVVPPHVQEDLDRRAAKDAAAKPAG